MNTRLAVALGLSLVTATSTLAATAPEDPAVQELVALEEKWMRAENTRDAAMLRMILDERFISISSGGVASRDEFIASVTGDPVDPTQTQTLTDRKFLVDGDTAVVTEIDHVHASHDGKAVEFAVRCTTTYVRRDGRWLALAEVFSKAPAS